MKKSCQNTCFLLTIIVPLCCEIIETLPHQSGSGYSSIFYEMPSIRLCQWRASTVRCTPFRVPEDYKGVVALKSLYLTGVSSHPLMWLFYSRMPASHALWAGILPFFCVYRFATIVHCPGVNFSDGAGTISAIFCNFAQKYVFKCTQHYIT